MLFGVSDGHIFFDFSNYYLIVIDRTIGGGALGTSPTNRYRYSPPNSGEMATGYRYSPPNSGEMATGPKHVLEEVLTILHRQEGDTKKMINMLEEEMSHMDVSR